MTLRRSALAAVLAITAADVSAETVKTDLHGIALGMTAEQVVSAAKLACSKPDYAAELICKDSTEGSDYTATFSGGDPSVVLAVARSFCARDTPEAILDRALTEFASSRSSAHADPNGFHIDLDAKTEAILNADDGTCPDGRGKHYVLSLRSNGLITTESDHAVDRLKKSLR